MTTHERLQRARAEIEIYTATSNLRNEYVPLPSDYLPKKKTNFPTGGLPLNHPNVAGECILNERLRRWKARYK